MASAKQIAWRKKFARMSKRGDFRKAKKSTLHLTKGDIVSHKMIKGKMWTSVTSKGAKKKTKTLKLNPHNPIVEEMKKLEKKYYIKREPTGDATVRRRGDDKEIFFIPNLSEFTDPIDISSSPQNNGKILFMLDSGGLVNLPT